MNGTPSLTIGIDARAAAEVPAGRGRLVRELLRALAARSSDRHRYLLYSRRTWGTEELDESFAWRLIDRRDPWWHLRAARAANAECDVFLSCNSYLTTWFLRIPAVPIVHDMLAFDPTMRPNRRSSIIERLTLAPAVRRSAGLIANSQATADALTRRFPAAKGRTTFALLGPATAPSESLPAAEALALPRPGFVLAVGTLEPRKNLPRLVAAYQALEEDVQRRHPLVVVGAQGWRAGETLAALRTLGERCTMLGYVSDAALLELYRRCALFCYPSLGEGFGLPVLEAMASGAAVLTSNVSSLPEVGGEAVEYVDPYDTASITAAIQRVLSDDALRDRLRAAGLRRAEEFSWASFAEHVLAVLDQTASSRS